MQTILAVDDAKDTLMLLEFDLQAEGYQVLTADGGESALAILAVEPVDLVLLDLYMPGLSGTGTLEKIHQNPDFMHLPVIMLSASDDEDEIVEALELGAHDYVTKPYMAKVLLARIRNALRLREKSLKLENLAKTDYLTEINNKGQFEHLAHKTINQMSRIDHNLVIAMLDIDRFKAVNDTYGHDAGDMVLKQFAQLLSSTFRDYDIIGRIGGEEFAVCMPNTEQDEGFNACERFRCELEKLAIDIGEGQSINITASIGLVSAKQTGIGYDFGQLMHQADACLYQAKEQSRNVVVALPADHDISNATANDTPTKSQKYAGIDYDIGVSNVLGDDNLFKEILQMFYDDHHLDGGKIQQAIDGSDQASLKHLVHTLKGVACSIGAMQLFENTKVLDVAVNENHTASYQSLFDDVKNELERVVGGIRAELNID